MNVPEAPTVDDALSLIVTHLREHPDQVASHGYDVHLPIIWEEYVRVRDGLPKNEYVKAAQFGPELSPAFYAAAWELCRRGIFRPGVKRANEQVTEEGQGGNSYSITPMGRHWLENADHFNYAPTGPTRQAEMLAPFHARFGDGFRQRAQEAVNCYLGTAYLGCCVMCGAAAESILLAVAIERVGDEEGVLKTYRSAGGRGRVENRIVGQVIEPHARRFRSFTDLLNYWRDDAAHGIATSISEIEAYDALGRLLRFAHFVDDHWDIFTR